MSTVLIGSCGGITGNYLARHLSGLGYQCIGTDLVGPGATAQWLKGFVSSPEEASADVYLPVHSQEILRVAKEPPGIPMALHPIRALALHDKRNLYRACAQLRVEHCRYGYDPPVFAKQVAGSGGKGSFRCDSDEQMNFAADAGMIVLEFVDGPEITCDALFVHGFLHCMHARLRVKTLGGAAIVCETYQGNSSEAVAQMFDAMTILGREFGMHGPANAQFIIDEARGPVLTDLNLRFASGGLPCTVRAGYDIPGWTVKVALGEELPSLPTLKPTHMARYLDEYFSAQEGG